MIPFRCVVTFRGGFQVFTTVSHLDELESYVEDWHNAGKTRLRAEDIRNIKVLEEDEEPAPHVRKHLKELR